MAWPHLPLPLQMQPGFLQQRRKSEPGGTQGGDLGWVRGKMVHYLLLQRRLRAACGEGSWGLAPIPTATWKEMPGEALQLQLRLLLQGPRQDGRLRWCAHTRLGAQFTGVVPGKPEAA